jgi:hypothetical protein
LMLPKSLGQNMDYKKLKAMFIEIVARCNQLVVCFDSVLVTNLHKNPNSAAL